MAVTGVFGTGVDSEHLDERARGLVWVGVHARAPRDDAAELVGRHDKVDVVMRDGDGRRLGPVLGMRC